MEKPIKKQNKREWKKYQKLIKLNRDYSREKNETKT